MRSGISRREAARLAAVRRAEVLSLTLELAELKKSLTAAFRDFNASVEPELIEASVYEINSLQSRYAYLIRMVKTLSRDPVEPFRFPRRVGGEASGGGDSS